MVRLGEPAEKAFQIGSIGVRRVALPPTFGQALQYSETKPLVAFGAGECGTVVRRARSGPARLPWPGGRDGLTGGAPISARA
jgi:hypothetical protein